jgi:FixJ family two-component response regulator
MNAKKPRVLFVDDEPDILAAIKLNLRGLFHVDTATSGREGLVCADVSEPYEVIVSDMRMPEMNGARFLAASRLVAAGSVRILLTGETDLSAAVEAVNRGSIFRFLKKPCSTQELVEALNAAVEHHRVITAERDLLENTLKSIVRLLTDILGHVHPQAFSRSARIHKIVEHLSERLDLPETWSFEIAGMLAQIALVTVPAETVEKCCTGEELDDWEVEVIAKVPDIGGQLIESIPRLESVASMVARHGKAASQEELSGEPQTWDPAVLGGELLRLATAFENFASENDAKGFALSQIRIQQSAFHKTLVDCLEGYELGLEGMKIVSLQIDQIGPGMVTQQDIRSESGGLLASKGQTIDSTFLQRLRNFNRGVGVKQPIRVLSPVRYLNSQRRA